MKSASLALAAAASLLSACASMSGAEAARAPEPAKAVDAASFYTGRWYEIGRTPMKLTDGCVAGTTDYLKDDHGRLRDLDACHADTPAGKEKTVGGPLTILNPGQNSKIRVDYRLFGVFPVKRVYWIVDHGDDWFIQSTPDLTMVNIYTRDPRPSPARLVELNARLKATGYDMSKLEYPATFPEGQR
jgi:apolipoprotein D and lipocalin family protein